MQELAMNEIENVSGGFPLAKLICLVHEQHCYQCPQPLKSRWFNLRSVMDFSMADIYI